MMMKRTIHDEGHFRKFLVVVDDTEECDRAVTYATYRAAATGGALVMMVAVELEHFNHWLGVKEIMLAEAHEAAQERLAQFKERVDEIAPIPTECVVREGKVAEQITALIEEDKDIGILVLAAAVGSKEGPGPLVASISSQSGKASFPLPVTIVPGDLSDADIMAIC
ncbi:universal stress protein [uncultured Cohaesibacter sp.]|uniref:universal stress protein n=1 Tax=uncultured Cohaesibacter sp. TaxID=1002546 RepID=UPI0029C88E0D|nr:universal stress protein [uncultured Cohaesibacter sp.]